MARASSRNAKAKTSVKVDFTNVEASGNHPEGRFLFTVEGVPEIKTSDNSGNDYINWKLKSSMGMVWHMTSLAPQALFNLRNVLESLGLEVEQSAMDLDLTELEGLTCGGEVEHEVYGGKKRARLIDIFPEAELDDEGAGTPAPKGGKGKPAEEEEEEGEDLTYADLAEATKEELLEIAKDNEVEGITLKLKKDLEALRAHIAEQLELEAPEEEQEEGEEPTYASVQEMEKDELLALAKEHEVDGITLKLKKDLDALRDHICEALELEEEETKPAAKPASRRKAGASKELAVKSKVTFVDDGEDVSGVVKSINTKEGFAVVVVDGDDWEVELADLTVA